MSLALLFTPQQSAPTPEVESKGGIPRPYWTDRYYRKKKQQEEHKEQETVRDVTPSKVTKEDLEYEPQLELPNLPYIELLPLLLKIEATLVLILRSLDHKQNRFTEKQLDRNLQKLEHDRMVALKRLSIVRGLIPQEQDEMLLVLAID